ncbi:hypothetical protein KUCAC02_000150 [Chaenocephalus aceratus]|nr:hypothetical protein KUCAC02_000150 [Chaenocephalus aceratus]
MPSRHYIAEKGIPALHTKKRMLAKWDIENDKVHVVMRDNAANMKKAFADMGVQSLGCFAHTLQLVVIQGLLASEASSMLSPTHEAVGHFKHSPKAYSIREDIQKDLHMQHTTPAGRVSQMEQYSVHDAEPSSAKEAAQCLCSGPRPSMHALCQPMGACGEGSCGLESI